VQLTQFRFEIAYTYCELRPAETRYP